jgi:uncharacterized protein
MVSKKIKENIKKEAKTFFEGCTACHDWTHVERVTILALKIGKKEKANLDVLEIASLLHDIGRKEEMEHKGYKLDEEIIENVLHCIITHRYRNEHKPKTIEAKVLFDADKLDSIGAVGIARDFLFAGYIKHGVLYSGNEKKLAKTNKDYAYTDEDTALLEYEIKLKKIKNKILTKTGKEFAKERDNFMKQFFKRFWKEVEGKL